MVPEFSSPVIVNVPVVPSASMVVSCAHSEGLAPAQMMVDEPSSVTVSVAGAVFEPLVLRAMSLTAFAPVDATIQLTNPPVAPADPASMSVE